jgi:hypothetical protein
LARSITRPGFAETLGTRSEAFGYNSSGSDPNLLPELEMREFVGELYLRKSRRVFSTLVRLLGDFDLAEEAMHEALPSER